MTEQGFINRLKTSLISNIYIEDNKMYIKNKFKYEVFNLIERGYPQFIEDIEKKNDIVREVE